MILLTVGTHTRSFRRLVEAVDELVGRGIIREEVEAQIGCTDYVPRHLSWSRSWPYDDFARRIAAASLVIAHAGAGIVILCRREGKPLVVVPRQKRYGEHTNDHQVEMAREMDEQGLAAVAYEMSDLPRAIKRAAGMNPGKICRRDLPAFAVIESFLSRCAREKRSSG